MRYLLCLLIIFTVSCNVFCASFHQEKQEIIIHADNITSFDKENFIQANGNILIIYGNYKVMASKLIYDFKDDSAFAYGDVVVSDNQGNVFTGDKIYFKSHLKALLIKNLALKLKNDSLLAAKLFLKLQKTSYLSDAEYTSCPICSSFKRPLWQINASNVTLDHEDKTIIYRHAFFEIYGVPIFYLPYFFHSIEYDKAKSGILIPVIKGSSFKIPIYFRIKPNMDLTFTPKYFSSTKVIYEGELRHKLYKGEYYINGSLLGLPKRNDKTKQRNRYHIFSEWKFKHNGWEHGGGVNHVSDVSYLKNFGYESPTYLSSNLYFSKVMQDEYIDLRAIKFQGLTKNSRKEFDPAVLPFIQHKKSFIGPNNSSINISSNILNYQQKFGPKILWFYNQSAFIQNYLFKGGHIFSISTDLHSKIYSVSDNSKDVFSNSKNKTSWYLLPETEISWRKLYFQKLANNYHLNYEPKVSLLISPYNNRFSVIRYDKGTFEISKSNLFGANKYRGINKQENSSSRISYGISSELKNPTNNLQIKGFLGQQYATKNPKLDSGNYLFSTSNAKFSNIITNISINYYNTQVYQKFSLEKDFSKIHFHELGVSTYGDFGNLNAGIINTKDFFYEKNQLQTYLNSAIKLSDFISLEGSVRFNLSSKIKVIDYNAGITYYGACISTSFGVSKSLASDPERKINKKETISFSLSLKSLGNFN